MKIERLPVFDEKVTIETYAKSHNRLFLLSGFNIKDEAGNTIIEMVATFVLMDRDTRKVHPVMSEITDAFDSEFQNQGSVVPVLGIRGGVEQEYRVRFYDLDMNGHVNNTSTGLGFEVMGADFLTQHVPKKVHLKICQRSASRRSHHLSIWTRGAWKLSTKLLQMVRSMPKLKLSGKK